MLLLPVCHSLKIHFVICQKYVLLTNNNRLFKSYDTGTCDISFSLASNSHGNFYIKIAFD